MAVFLKHVNYVKILEINYKYQLKYRIEKYQYRLKSLISYQYRIVSNFPISPITNIHPKPERAEGVYIRQVTSAHGITNLYQLLYMCNHVWANQHNNSPMDSLYLYRDLLDCIMGLNLMIKHFYDVILKHTIKSCRAHYYKGLINTSEP